MRRERFLSAVKDQWSETGILWDARRLSAVAEAVTSGTLQCRQVVAAPA